MSYYAMTYFCGLLLTDTGPYRDFDLCNDLLMINSSKQYINNVSRTALRVTLRVFCRFI